jgi:hypothetical protein
MQRWIEYLEANLDTIRQKAIEGNILCINIISIGELILDGADYRSTNMHALKTMLAEYQRSQNKEGKQ